MTKIVTIDTEDGNYVVGSKIQFHGDKKTYKILKIKTIDIGNWWATYKMTLKELNK